MWIVFGGMYLLSRLLWGDNSGDHTYSGAIALLVMPVVLGLAVNFGKHRAGDPDSSPMGVRLWRIIVALVLIIGVACLIVGEILRVSP